jgi:hypothetical protein
MSPLKPQCGSETWRKKKSCAAPRAVPLGGIGSPLVSLEDIFELEHPLTPRSKLEANTTPPIPVSFKSSRRSVRFDMGFSSRFADNNGDRPFWFHVARNFNEFAHRTNDSRFGSVSFS